MKVLLVEDDLVLGESLQEYLEINNIETKWLSDDREVENIFLNETFDVIVLDLILRYQKGEDLLRKLRNKGVNIPVLILTAKKDLKDKETCFERGADDYLTKPFAPKELLLRLQALARRNILPSARTIHIKDVSINLDARTVFRNGREIKLSRKEWELLSYLLKHRGQIVSKEQILNYVWGGSSVSDEVVRTYIKKIRKLFPEICIETYKGRGYQLK